ncbi:ATP-dependent DNA helicase RecQ [Nymphon striatum]|nr:ATP-dependent DNA helicase RecQ [Nymphon striatum]
MKIAGVPVEFNVATILEAIIALLPIPGKNTFVIMPTGGGKSLCFQLPALMQEGTAIVVSPLIALMKNQVDAIRGISSEHGIAHVLNSSLTKTEIKQVKEDISSGITKLLYVAPESLTKDEYVEFLQAQKISFLAVDEAHCISEWGHDFRPEYRNLRSIVNRLGDNIPIIGLTATATAKGKSGIIYCLSRKRVQELAQVLQVNGVSAVPYHAGFDAKTRSKYQDMFLMQDVDIVVATIAFGMGIDKPDVRFVIHHDIPKSIESYYQETGRAGRDDGEGHCLAFYSYKDIEKLEKFMSGKPVAEQEIGNALLQEVVAYAETSMSRRKFMLHYFGESFDEVVKGSVEKFKSKEIVHAVRGQTNALISSHKTNEKEFFGIGSDQVPPFVIFQDPSLEDMALKYPISVSELTNIHGVGEGKAKKYGAPFVDMIKTYVDEYEITRPDDMVVKSTGANSALKLYIIQNVDRKLPLSDIASARGLEIPELIKEMEQIVFSGTKLNLGYWIDDVLDEDQQEEIHEYFLEAETDDLETAMEEFDGDYEDEELRLYRLKFISEVAN